MSELTYNLDRKNNVDNRVDALGKRWQIIKNKQTGLCYTRPDPDRSDAVIPSNMEGLWTKGAMLEAEILKYVNATWDKAEEAVEKAERKAQVVKENAKK